MPGLTDEFRPAPHEFVIVGVDGSGVSYLDLDVHSENKVNPVFLEWQEIVSRFRKDSNYKSIFHEARQILHRKVSQREQ